MPRVLHQRKVCVLELLKPMLKRIAVAHENRRIAPGLHPKPGLKRKPKLRLNSHPQQLPTCSIDPSTYASIHQCIHFLNTYTPTYFLRPDEALHIYIYFLSIGQAKAAKIKSFAASSGKKSTPRIRSPIPPSHSEPHHSTNDGGDEQSQPVDSEEDDIAVRLEREIAAFRQRKGITDPHMEKSLKSPTVAHSTGMNSALPPGCPNTATTPVSWSSRQTRTTLGTAQSPSMSSDMLVRMLTSLAEETEDLPVQQLAARLIATAEAVAEVGVRPAAVQSTRHALGTRLQV